MPDEEEKPAEEKPTTTRERTDDEKAALSEVKVWSQAARGDDWDTFRRFCSNPDIDPDTPETWPHEAVDKALSMIRDLENQ